MSADSAHIHCISMESYLAVPDTWLVESDYPNLAVFLLSPGSRLARQIAGVYRIGYGAGPEEVPDNVLCGPCTSTSLGFSSRMSLQRVPLLLPVESFLYSLQTSCVLHVSCLHASILADITLPISRSPWKQQDTAAHH